MNVKLAFPTFFLAFLSFSCLFCLVVIVKESTLFGSRFEAVHTNLRQIHYWKTENGPIEYCT